MDDNDLPTAHPAFVAHFTDPVYEDAAGELAPFGTDEGFDLLYEWEERREELPGMTLDEVLDESGFGDMPEALATPETAQVPTPGGQIDAATIIVGAAFTMLRLNGSIDAAGQTLALRALDVLIKRFGSAPELIVQRNDLQSWKG